MCFIESYLKRFRGSSYFEQLWYGISIALFIETEEVVSVKCNEWKFTMFHTKISEFIVQRRFAYVKFTFLLALTLGYQFPNQTQIQEQSFYRDLQFCEQCFQHQTLGCANFFQQVEGDHAPSAIEGLANLLSFSGKRRMKFWKFRSARKGHLKIISKYMRETQLKSFKSENKTVRDLKAKFIETENLEGLQLCPQKDLSRLVDYFERESQHCELSIWLHFTLDVEPLLMPLLGTEGFPVPKTYATCGFTLFQELAGRALLHYYSLKSFEKKIKMAKQLLEAVLKFSRGFDGFRIYITDLSADNVIWNEQTEHLYFVDLDTVLIVDSAAKHLQPQIHKHVYIECEDCFAYSQQEICAHQLSDINIFAACQLLRENLSRERKAGFLYPIPAEILAKHPKFTQLLDECVDCLGTKCLNRFAVAEELAQLFKSILIGS